MSIPVIIFGAGKTGRGFIAHLCQKSGQNFVLIDSNHELVDSLNEKKSFNIKILKSKPKTVKINAAKSFYDTDHTWLEAFKSCDLVFTAVAGNNFPALAQSLTTGLLARYAAAPDKPLNIITCENLVNAAGLLREAIDENIGDKKTKEWLANEVGFAESLVLKTCIQNPDDPLGILAQDLHYLPCDRSGLVEPLPHLKGLRLLDNYQQQLIRKIYTYNCINAVICYLGAQKGYQMLLEAASDPEIYHIAQQAAFEASEALIKEFDFDRFEQYEWVKNALDKFSDKRIPDPICRNARNPLRKLQREDRLMGPALLALKHSIFPENILKGIQAAFNYQENGTSVNQMVREKGMSQVLQEVCGLQPKEQLFNTLTEILRDHGA